MTNDEHTLGGEGGVPLSRAWLANFGDSYDQAGNLLKFQGPDGDVTTATYDDLGRMATVNRANQLSATVSYDDASRVTQVDYGNGTRTVYSYDDANRPTEIRHEGPAASVRFKLTYTSPTTSGTGAGRYGGT